MLIVLIQEGHDRLLFDNVTHIKEETKPSIVGGAYVGGEYVDGVRNVINLYCGDKMLMGGDDINPMTTIVTILPYAEKE